MIEVTEGGRPDWLPATPAEPAPECSRGWGARCAASKGKRCRCHCGGRNHGNREALGKELETSGGLTDRRVFEQQDIESRAFLAGAPFDGAFTFDRVPTGELDIMRRPILRAEVRFDGEDFPQPWKVHSPTGYEWGYGGSGPADLALNMLGRFVVAPEAWRLHQRFKFAFIASLPETGGSLSATAVRYWIGGVWADEQAEADRREHAALASFPTSVKVGA